MAADLVDKLAKAGLGSATNILSFADRKIKLNTEEDASEICTAIDGFPAGQLTSLVLEGNTLGIAAAEAIGRSLQTRPELQQLHGKDLFTGRSKQEIPPAMRHLGDGMISAGARLSVLDLSDNAVGPVGMDGLHTLLTSPVCYALQELLLNNNGWGPTGGVRMADCLLSCYHKSVENGTPMQLRVFVSGRSRLEDPAACRLAEFFKLVRTMVRVVMPQNGIYHEGVQALAEALCENTSLQHLDLNDNLLTPKGARALAGSLSRMKQLRVLNLSDCLLKTSGAQAIAAAIKGNNPNLQELQLGFNEIDTTGALSVIEAVRGKQSLQLLQLDGNQLGEEGVQLVQQAAQRAALDQALQPIEEDEGEPDSDEEEQQEKEEEDEGEEVEEVEGTSPLKRIDKPAQVKACTLSEFVCQPTAARFLGLGDNRLQLFNEEISKTQDLEKCDSLRGHLVLLSAVCRVHSDAPAVEAAVTAVVDRLMESALSAAGSDTALLSNTLLVYMGLIKCEDKRFAVSWDLKGMLRALARVVRKSNFPREIRDTLQTFLARPNKTVDIHQKEKHLLLQALYQ